MENYFEIKTSFNENNKEEIYGYLYTFDVGSILEEDDFLIIYFEEKRSPDIGFLEKEMVLRKCRQLARCAL